MTAYNDVGESSGFRRTLVGLKRPIERPRGERPARFQTNPCGIEALYKEYLDEKAAMFQTNPCGIEAAARGVDLYAVETCFRRTLVGLKLTVESSGRTRRVGFQTNPCGIEASPTTAPGCFARLVSDEPLWD